MLKREDITRERVEFLVAEASRTGNFPALTHEEREGNRKQFLFEWTGKTDLWIFGYGSLIWNPAFHYLEQRKARIYGYNRRFCLYLTIGRGSPEKPGLMLALDRGGSCNGIAFRIAANEVESETNILWMREMISGAYQPRWMPIYTDKGPVKGFTFVVNRDHERYLKHLDFDETVKGISRGEGHLGSCRDYLANTVDGLEKLGISDNYLRRLQRTFRDL